MSSGKTCAVIKCANSSVKIASWKKKECEIHKVLQVDCPCLVPYSLHRFPGRAEDQHHRQKWVKNINRQGWVPNHNSRVCGIHFPDGRPTKEHPHPVLHMGYEHHAGIVSSVRAPPKRRCVESLRVNGPKVSRCAAEPAEVEVDVNNLENIPLQKCDIGFQGPDITEHNYCSSKSTKDSATQTDPAPSISAYDLDDKDKKEMQLQEKSEAFKSVFTAARASTLSWTRKKELDTAFFKMIYVDYEALSKGEREGMQHFARVAQPGYTPPCYHNVRNTLMPQALQEIEAKLRDLLRSGDGFVLSADIWTNRRGHSFLCILASFIDRTFRKRTLLLGCDHIQGDHTTDRIYHKYESVLRYWNVEQRVIRVITNSASNMVKAFNLIPVTEEEAESEEEASSSTEQDQEDRPLAVSQIAVEEVAAKVETMINQYFTMSDLHLRCPIHMLQLAIKDAVNEHSSITRLLLKVGQLVRSVRKGTLNTVVTDRLGVRPTTACITRWSSQLHMIASVLRLFQEDPMWQNKLKTNATHLTLNEVRQLTHLVRVLSPLADLTEKLQKEFGNLGMILPAVTEIKSLLSNDAGLPMTIAAFGETLANNMSTRYEKYYTDKHLVLASVLDPRFKTEWIIRDESVCNKVGEIRDLLIEETMGVNPSGGAPDTACPSDTDSGPKSGLFGSYYSQQLHTPPDAKAEVEKYLSSSRQDLDADVISFWQENAVFFPRLAEVARRVFSIPSGSAGAERVFSTAGLLARSHRSGLKPQTVARLVFLKVNAKEIM